MKGYDYKKSFAQFGDECWDVITVCELVVGGIIPFAAQDEGNANAGTQLWQEAENHIKQALKFAECPSSPEGDEAALNAATERFAARHKAKKTATVFTWQEKASKDASGQYNDAGNQAILNAQTDAYAHVMLAITRWMHYGLSLQTLLTDTSPNAKELAKEYKTPDNRVTQELMAARENFLGAFELEGKGKQEIEGLVAANYPELKQTFDTIKEQESKSGGCYVATAVYGSYDCPEVWTLRRFRDFSLARSVAGRAFVRLYYATSPTLVKWFGNARWFKAGCRALLDPMVANLRKAGYAGSPYHDRQW